MTTFVAADQVFRSDVEPDVFLGQLDAAFGPFLDRVLGLAGVRHVEAAKACDVSRQTFEQHLEATSKKRVRATWLYVLPIKARIRVLSDMLGAAHAIVELPVAAERTDVRFFTTAVREVTAAVLKALEAADDDRFDRAEGTDIEALCDRAISILLTIRELARQAKREGIIGLGVAL